MQRPGPFERGKTRKKRRARPEKTTATTTLQETMTRTTDDIRRRRRLPLPFAYGALKDWTKEFPPCLSIVMPPDCSPRQQGLTISAHTWSVNHEKTRRRREDVRAFPLLEYFELGRILHRTRQRVEQTTGCSLVETLAPSVSDDECDLLDFDSVRVAIVGESDAHVGVDLGCPGALDGEPFLEMQSWSVPVGEKRRGGADRCCTLGSSLDHLVHRVGDASESEVDQGVSRRLGSDGITLPIPPQ